MLDAKSLEVLQGLKSEIKANKEILSGFIKGTGKSFGFAVADDGKEYFLAPDEMARVFPGDKVTFTVAEQDDGKHRAELEELVSSEFQVFNGVFYKRGKAQGVEPFTSGFNGWLFIPPKQVGETQHNDIVQARVSRHPWDSGKAQAEIIRSMGSADNNRSWYSMTLNEADIPEDFTESEIASAQESASRDLPADEYSDLTSVPFVTIDSATTRDMDDAVYAKESDNGWTLSVAIADASAFIEPGSVLDKAAFKRLTTTYLPGLVLPMLPEPLSNDAMSLVPNQTRPALVFSMNVNPEGEVSDFSVQQALIKSSAKLSYAEVSDWLDNKTTPDEFHDSIIALNQATSALFKWRAEHTNPMQDRVDYRIKVDENFAVEAIQIEEKNSARSLIEEAMVATNSQIAQWLSGESSLFMTHQGFKSDRETELKGLLRDYAPDVAELDGSILTGFLKIMRAANETLEFPLASVLQKRFERGQWKAEPAPHFGLGVTHYTNGTSPIRKYGDLVIHRQIKSKLKDETFNIDAEVLEALNTRIHQSRSVANAIENRLRHQWLSQQDDESWSATVAHVNANGLVAKLDSNGATGFIDFRKKKDEYSYDPLRMMLKFESFNFVLGQKLTVKIKKIEGDQLALAIVD